MPTSSQRIELAALGADGRDTLVERFVTAFESGDVPAILSLLAEDARLTMPPLPAWFDGRAEIGRFLDLRMFGTPWKLLPLRANSQLAFACYQGDEDGTRYPLSAVNLVTVHAGLITEITGFLYPGMYRHFPVPAEL
jgi:RNA polymerase sigma-70 factor (ECF subfamily)